MSHWRELRGCQSTRHAVNSSQANKQANIKAVLPQQYNYP